MQNQQLSKRRCSALILAAGYSSRLGKPKFTLLLDGKKTFLEYLVCNYEEFGCKEISVVLNPQGIDIVKKEFPSIIPRILLVQNDYPDWGRFYSIKLGIKRLKTNTPTFIHNVDNPFIDINILDKLYKGIGNFDYLNPAFKGKGGHPVLISAIIAKEILSEPSNELSLKDFLSRFQKIALEVNESRILLNVNTMEDYQQMLKQ